MHAQLLQGQYVKVIGFIIILDVGPQHCLPCISTIKRPGQFNWWAEHWANRHVIVPSDNQTAVGIINKGSTGNPYQKTSTFFQE